MQIQNYDGMRVRVGEAVLEGWGSNNQGSFPEDVELGLGFGSQEVGT